jgi:hypothetical protein
MPESSNAPPDVDPVEFARAMMGISPEDAEKVRERSSPTRRRPGQSNGPTADYGDDEGPAE